MEKYAIIVAGGSGSRMKSVVPKQFLMLNKLPVLMHTLWAFYDCDQSIKLILTLPRTEVARWESLCVEFNFQVPHRVVIGGETRFHSVKHGLNTIEFSEGYVAVHDGVRPLLSQDLINRSFQLASEKGNAVAAVPLKDSIRKIDAEGKSKHEVRDSYRMVQTPQTFSVMALKKAYERGFEESFTDDASVVEASGIEVNLIMGDYENIKITTPEDLLIAEKLMKRKSE